MYNTVYYVVKSNLHYYPPCMSQIKMLQDVGAKVVVLYGSSERIAVEDLVSRGIECVELVDPRGKYKGVFDKANNWLSFRKALKRFLKKINVNKSIIWFGNAETLMPMIGVVEKKYNYIITFLELLDHKKNRLKLLKRMAQNAKAVVTCEETRSYLMQYWFSLNKLPYTMPNKPYSVNINKNATVTTEKGQEVMSKVAGNKYLIYQGIFQNVEYLEVVASVLNDCFPDIYFVMMGIDRRGVVDRIKGIYPNTVSIDYIPSPLHLEITSNAYMGLLFYDPDSLNKAFCAPNKIFEYSRFGLPIIGNNIPGLANTIGKAHAGECVDFSYDKIRNAIENIINNYDKYQENSLRFYNSVDNTQIIRQIITDLGIDNHG